MIITVLDYLVPRPPKEVSVESKLTIGADTKTKQNIDVWTRHKDDQARAANREWLKLHSKTFAKRWTALCCALLLLGWLSSGYLYLEVPFVLGGCASGVGAMVFWWLHLRPNVLS